MSREAELVSDLIKQEEKNLPDQVWICVRGPDALRMLSTGFLTSEEAREAAEANAAKNGLPALQWTPNKRGWRSQELSKNTQRFCYYVEALDVQK